MVKPFFLAVMTAFSATAAQADTYSCQIAAGAETDGWIAREILVKVKDKTTVVDDVVLSTVGKPIEARIARENSKVAVFSWEVESTDIANNYIRMKYRLTVQKADGAAQISATPLGYANSYSARGACAIS